jgi:hypothetical protein
MQHRTAPSLPAKWGLDSEGAAIQGLRFVQWFQNKTSLFRPAKNRSTCEIPALQLMRSHSCYILTLQFDINISGSKNDPYMETCHMLHHATSGVQTDFGRTRFLSWQSRPGPIGHHIARTAPTLPLPACARPPCHCAHHPPIDISLL